MGVASDYKIRETQILCDLWMREMSFDHSPYVLRVAKIESCINLIKSMQQIILCSIETGIDHSQLIYENWKI